MGFDGRPRQVEGYAQERLGEEVLLYHPGRTTVLYLNAAAHLVWQLCDGRRTVEDIQAMLAAAYSDADADVAGDVAEALARLSGFGAVVE